MPTPLIIIGAGGFSLEVNWIANAMNAAGTADYAVAGLADDNVPGGSEFGGLPVIGSPVDAARKFPGAHFHIAIGDNRARLRLAEQLVSLGLTPASLISPQALVAIDSEIGAGVYIGPFASIAPQTVIGDYSVVNVHAVVGHEAHIGKGAQLCPGVIVTGRCRVGQGAFLGSNAVLQPCISVGDWARVSANTFAATDVESGVTLASMPGRPVFSRRNRDTRDA